MDCGTLKAVCILFINALSKLINEFGGIIRKGVSVEEILFLKDQAIGVRTSKGIEKADIVVCNADFPYTMKKLVKNDYYKDEYTDKKLSKMKYSCSTFIVYLGLKKNTHN